MHIHPAPMKNKQTSMDHNNVMMMKKGDDVDELVKELRIGEGIAEKVKDHLSSTNPSSRQELNSLIQHLIAFYNNTLTILNNRPPPLHRQVATVVGSLTTTTTTVADSFSWRKYGQKMILGSNHPRSYYRCTHRRSRGCLAKKQVQRSNHHPHTFQITYQGMHTCELATLKQSSDHGGRHVEGVDPLKGSEDDDHLDLGFEDFDEMLGLAQDPLAHSIDAGQFHDTFSFENLEDFFS